MMINVFGEIALSFDSLFSSAYPSLFPAYRDPSNNYRFNYGNLTGTAGDVFTGLALYFKNLLIKR